MWSAESRALLLPAATFRAAAADPLESARLRSRLLLLLFSLGCGVSALASGRFSPRLILDGAISFAFVPLTEIAVLAIVLSVGQRASVPFRRAASLFLIGNGPWLLWLLAIAAFGSFVPPSRVAVWMALLTWSPAVPALWSAYIDFQFFRRVSGRTAQGAWWDIALFHAIAWVVFAIYFFGIAVYFEVLPEPLTWLGLR